MLSNIWYGRKPLKVDDVKNGVDLVSECGVTTYMICSGSDFAYYRSKYSRPFGSDRDGELDSSADPLFLSYYSNFLNLEEEGTDIIKSSLLRAKEKGMEAFITYRMNDIHFCDVRIPVPVYATDFWMAHPEYWMGKDDRGWHSDGALNFEYPEVRQQKYNMIAEQLEKYDFIDGFELDFMRFMVFFPVGKGPEDACLMTDLVRRIRAKADSVSALSGHRILLTARVPQTWDSCKDAGLDVRTWVREGLVDFITLGNLWKGDPAINTDVFRKQSGIGRRIPVYVTIDDGMFQPREDMSHGMYRGAASFAYSHGADGICLFNYYFTNYIKSDCKEVPEQMGKVCRTRTPGLARELGCYRLLDGKNKSYSYYSGNPEYGLKYLSPVPLECTPESSAVIGFHIADKMTKHRPVQGILCFRSDTDGLSATFNGAVLQAASENCAILYDRLKGVKPGNKVHCFIVPASLIRRGDNKISISSESRRAAIPRIELILDYGDVNEYGYF